MFKQISKTTKEEILAKIKNGDKVTMLASQYGLSPKTIYGWLRNQISPNISIMEVSRLRRENEELKRIIGMITLEMERGKKIAIVNKANNKRLIAQAIGISNKNIYKKSKREMMDLKVRDKIERTFETHPAYGHRRLAIKLKMNRKKVLRSMKKFGLKPPRLWYQKRYITKVDSQYQDEFANLIKKIKSPAVNEIWSSDLTYLKYKDKFFYLSAIQDIATNEIISCSLGDMMLI